MNSMSRPHDNDDRACGCKKEKEKEASAVLLKCKTGSNVAVVTAVAPGNEYTVSTLTINTKKFDDACIKFEFASNIISLPGVGADQTINFQLYRLCKGETTRTAFGPQWTFLRTDGADPTSDTFTFIVCDCDCDCDCDLETCCTYTVVVNVIGSGTATINNPTLSALLVERTHC